MGSRCWHFLAFKALEGFQGKPRFVSVSRFPLLPPSLLFFWSCIRNGKAVPPETPCAQGEMREWHARDSTTSGGRLLGHPPSLCATPGPPEPTGN